MAWKGDEGRREAVWRADPDIMRWPLADIQWAVDWNAVIFL